MTDRIFTLMLWNRCKRISFRCLLLMIAASVAFVAAAQTACSKNVKVGMENSGPVRVVVLPFMITSEKAGGEKELQWTALASTALLIKASRRLPDIEVVPLWEVMPVAISAAGASRSFTDEIAAAIANWMSAQWTIMGEIRRTGSSSSYTVVVDFIPAASSTIPYRHIKKRRMENIGTNFYNGLRQWLRYVTAKQLPLMQIREPGLQAMRPLGEALDKEYGWFETAVPGTSQALIEELEQVDKDWIQLLFSPTMYPYLAK